MIRLSLATILLLGVFLSSCAPPPGVVRRAGWEASMDVAEALRTPSLHLDGIQDLTAPAQFRLTNEEVDQSASASFQYLPPHQMRIDVRGPLFQHVLTAVFDADTLWSLAEGQLHRFDANQGLADLLDIDLHGQDPRGALLGLVVPIDAHDSVRVDYPRADRAVATVLSPDGRQRRIWVNLLTGFVVREEGIDAGGRIRWRRDLSDYDVIDDDHPLVHLPQRVRIQSGVRVLDIRYGRWRLDRGLSRAELLQGIRN